jgi:hypothetical protein
LEGNESKLGSFGVVFRVMVSSEGERGIFRYLTPWPPFQPVTLLKPVLWLAGKGDIY